MTNKNAASELSFSVDLSEQVIHHIQFLKKVDSTPQLKNSDVLRHSLVRYEKYWLPLAAEHPDECLVPPLDIEWIWHCHMLSPEKYEKDCETIVGATINHTLCTTEDTEYQTNSRNYWQQKYNETDVPFDILARFLNQTYDTSFKSKLTYDILAAVERQSTFYYQVALPHYKDKKFIKSCLQRYRQFIFMRRQLDQPFLVPCYDIDLIWHTHQLNPIAYKEDMVRIIGHLFNHDDTDNDRTQGSKLDMAGKQTRDNWKSFFGEDFALCGAMYRGKSASGRFGVITEEDLHAHGRKTCRITINSLTLIFTPMASLRASSKVALFAYSTKDDRVIEEVFCVRRDNCSLARPDSITWTDIGSFEVVTEISDSLSFELRQQKGCSCYATESVIAQNKVDIMTLIEDNVDVDPHTKLEFQVSLSRNITVHVRGRRYIVDHEMYDLFKDEKRSLELIVGRNQYVSLPDDPQELLGPTDIEVVQDRQNSRCGVSTHSLKNTKTGVVDVTVKVIHNVSLMTSVIQVFYHEKMVALAHLISTNQLPLSSQVNSGVLSLDPGKGDRAVIIKNNQGDWVIITGHWKRFERGKAGTWYEKGEHGRPGQLSAKIYRFSDGTYTKCLISDHLFKIDQYLTGHSGDIDIDRGNVNSEMGEHIAAIFSFALLHVLCVPRPKGWKVGKSLDPVDSKRGEKSYKKTSTGKLLLAAGLLINTPSNYYLTNQKAVQNSSHIRNEDEASHDEINLLLPGGGNNDGCACYARTESNEKDYDSGLLGPGCGGCGGSHAQNCASTCGGGKTGAAYYSSKPATGRSTTSSTSASGGLFSSSNDNSTFGHHAAMTINLTSCGSSCGGGGGCGGGGFD